MEWYCYCLLDETSPKNTHFSNGKDNESGVAEMFDGVLQTLLVGKGTFYTWVKFKKERLSMAYQSKNVALANFN